MGSAIRRWVRQTARVRPRCPSPPTTATLIWTLAGPSILSPAKRLQIFSDLTSLITRLCTENRALSLRTWLSSTRVTQTRSQTKRHRSTHSHMWIHSTLDTSCDSLISAVPMLLAKLFMSWSTIYGEISHLELFFPFSVCSPSLETRWFYTPSGPNADYKR